MEQLDEMNVQMENENRQERPPKPEREKAPFWIRLCAWMVEVSIVISAIFLPYLLAGTPFSLFLLFGIVIVVHLLKDSIKGQSPGKFIFGLGVRMRDDSEKLPSFGRRMLRNLTLSRLTGTRVYRIKRRKIWVTLPLFLVFFALPFLMMLMIPDRTPLTAEEFTVHMEAQGFVVEDVLHMEHGPRTQEMETYLRVHHPRAFVMEFSVFSNDDSAKEAYSDIVFEIERAMAGAVSSQTEMGFANFNRLTITVGGEYIVLSRIGNTILYAQTSTGNRADMNNLLRELGY